MKKKKTKILLFLCLLIGIIAIIVIYTFKIKNEKYENIVYVNYDLNNEDIEGDYKTIHYYADLVYFLKNDVPEKYDADFFKNNAILIFKIIDENKRPEIQTYELSEESISIHEESCKCISRYRKTCSNRI